MPAMRILHCVGVVSISFVLLIGAAVALGDPPAPALPSLAELRRLAVSATDRESATKAYTLLFERANAAELVALRGDANVGIALQAAHRLRRSRDPKLVASSHPERFIGFLEGRAGISCPPGWASCFVMGREDHDAFVSGALRTYGPLGLVEIMDVEVGLKPGEGVPGLNHPVDKMHRIDFEGKQIECPAKIDLRSDHISIDKKRVPLDSTFWNAIRDRKRQGKFPWPHMNALIHEDKVLVVFWEWASNYPVFCLDATSGKLIWEADVWSPMSPARFHSLFGDYSYTVDLSANQQSLVVFGNLNDVLYAESFDMATGKPQWRFSPCLWDN